MEETIDVARDEAPRLKPAAVLLLVYPVAGGDLATALIERPQEMPTHKGQIALPGGGRKPGDASLLATALREAREEIGVASDSLRIVGGLQPSLTVVTPFLVYPFVAVTEHRPEFRIDHREVVRLIEVPLSDLRDPVHREDERRLIDGVPVWMPVFNVGGVRVWGLTARVLQDFLTWPPARISPQES